jgi:DNA-binding MarR family transcriptional regulator
MQNDVGIEEDARRRDVARSDGLVERLEAAGHVHRSLDPGNRRSMRVSLTDGGRSLVDTAVEAHVANEQALLAGLSTTGRHRLDAALRELLAVIEQIPQL